MIRGKQNHRRESPYTLSSTGANRHIVHVSVLPARIAVKTSCANRRCCTNDFGDIRRESP
jgi:hypothetical protein